MEEKKRGAAVWLTGLPSSGKSAVARQLKQRLARQGASVQILDSDELRQRLTPQPVYTEEERKWFYELVVFLAELLTENGVTVLIAATGPRRAYRENARARIVRFAEVYIDCPIEVCRRRDPKGLWRRAETGEIQSLPGAGGSYEPPLTPDLTVDTSQLTIAEAAGQIYQRLQEKGLFR